MYRIKDYEFQSFKTIADLHKSNYAVLDNEKGLGIKYCPHMPFDDEFRILHQLDQKQIPKVYDYGKEIMYKDQNVVLDQYFIVLEHTSDTDLVGYFQEKMKEDFSGQIKNIIECYISVCDPLEHLHSKNLIHCDIKPGHMMVDPDTNTTYLIDFELAIRKADIIKGISMDYASPEQIELLHNLRNQPEGVPLEAISFFLSIDDKTDIYSVGAVMYETLTKQKWKDSKIPPRDLNSLIPQKLENVIMASLEEDPSNRVDTAKNLKQLLQNLL
ncbi:MAG: protein kinase [Planctomycetes bacterium]|nr:protein kinase [Planctomycetota bacterium]